MGLAERRFIKTTEEETVAEVVALYNSLTGADLKFEVDWAALADENVEVLQNVASAIPNGIYAALRDVGRDELGKQALRDGLHAIRMGNVKEGAGEITFKDGVLVVTRPWRLGGWDTNINSDEVVRILEAGL
jgi:hypothetical protein